MTKEEFTYRVELIGGVLIDDLKRFFESNVCITKSTNRHPYADVLHEWVEGAEIEHIYDKELSNIFCKTAKATQALGADEYRIKPQEPTFEWQWIQTEDGETYWLTGYMTKHEANQCGCTIAVEDTKRERK